MDIPDTAARDETVLICGGPNAPGIWGSYYGAVVSPIGVSLNCELSGVEAADVVESVSISVRIWSHNESMGLRGRNVSGTPVYKSCNWWIAALKYFLNGANSGLPVIGYELRNSWPNRLARAKSIHKDWPENFLWSKNERLPNHSRPKRRRHS